MSAIDALTWTDIPLPSKVFLRMNVLVLHEQLLTFIWIIPLMVSMLRLTVCLAECYPGIMVQLMSSDSSLAVLLPRCQRSASVAVWSCLLISKRLGLVLSKAGSG